MRTDDIPVKAITGAIVASLVHCCLCLVVFFAHWKHIRSTNAIECVFATDHVRAYKTNGMGAHKATLAMAFKLIQEAQKTWRKIAKWQRLELVQAGRRFKDGMRVEDSAADVGKKKACPSTKIDSISHDRLSGNSISASPDGYCSIRR